jgi:hypothetical protein
VSSAADGWGAPKLSPTGPKNAVRRRRARADVIGCTCNLAPAAEEGVGAVAEVEVEVAAAKGRRCVSVKCRVEASGAGMEAGVSAVG